MNIGKHVRQAMSRINPKLFNRIFWGVFMGIFIYRSYAYKGIAGAAAAMALPVLGFILGVILRFGYTAIQDIRGKRN